MNGMIYIVQDGKRLIKMEQTAYTREEDFQKLLEQFPELLAGEQIDSVIPRRWLLISREMAIPSETGGGDRWSLDHLFLDQDGIPTLVEVKRKSDTRLRREVVGQMLDYVANAVVYWPVGEMYRQFVDRCEMSGIEPDKELTSRLGSEIETFWERAELNLKQGKVRLVFVADYIPPELQRVIEFLNERMSPTEVLGIEIRQYTGQGFSTHIPRVIGQTGEAQLKKQGQGGTRRSWDQESFFGDVQRRIDQGELTGKQGDFIRQLYDFSAEKARVKWGTGNVRGSFNPYFGDISNRAIYTVWSDGSLSVKLSWLTDKESAVEFRKIYQAELEKQGIPISEEGGEFSVVAWKEWVAEFIAATENAVEIYNQRG